MNKSEAIILFTQIFLEKFCTSKKLVYILKFGRKTLLVLSLVKPRNHKHLGKSFPIFLNYVQVA